MSRQGLHLCKDCPGFWSIWEDGLNIGSECSYLGFSIQEDVQSPSNLLHASHAMTFLTLKSRNESGIWDPRYLNESTLLNSCPEIDLMESVPGMFMVSSSVSEAFRFNPSFDATSSTEWRSSSARDSITLISLPYFWLSGSIPTTVHRNYWDKCEKRSCCASPQAM